MRDANVIILRHSKHLAKNRNWIFSVAHQGSDCGFYNLIRALQNMWLFLRTSARTLLHFDCLQVTISYQISCSDDDTNLCSFFLQWQRHEFLELFPWKYRDIIFMSCDILDNFGLERKRSHREGQEEADVLISTDKTHTHAKGREGESLGWGWGRCTPSKSLLGT